MTSFGLVVECGVVDEISKFLRRDFEEGFALLIDGARLVRLGIGKPRMSLCANPITLGPVNSLAVIWSYLSR
jgi:hypothetical protein